MRSFIVFLCLVPTLLFARQTQLETLLKEAIKGKKAEIGNQTGLMNQKGVSMSQENTPGLSSIH